jgi:hypothetical protein
MTIKSHTAGSLALSEIQAEFGGSYPIALTEYLAGGQYVNSGVIGYPGGVPTPIPSSVPIRISNFYGASAEPSATTLANYFWDYRSSLVRYADNYQPYNDSYPGDLWTRNTPNARFVGSFTNSWSFSNGSLPITSAFFTVVSVVTGAIGNYGGILGVNTTSSGTLISDPAATTFIGNGGQPSLVGDGFGVSFKAQVFQGQINSVTSHTISSTHRGSNNGAWTHVYLIPGKWAFGSIQVNFDANYSPTLAAGDMHMIIMERGGDFSAAIPRPAGVNNMTTDQFWYNAAGVQMSVNTTSSPVNLVWPQIEQYDYYGSTYVSYWDTYAITPRVGAILTRFF